jgi:hypothetical protein
MSIHCAYCGGEHERAIQVKACASRHHFVEVARQAKQELAAPAVRKPTFAELADTINVPDKGIVRAALPNPSDNDRPLLFQLKRGRNPGVVFVNAITSHGGTRRAVTAHDQYVVLAEIARDPAAARKLYGDATEHCSRCGKFLVETSSRAVGLGPDCYEKVYGVKQPKVTS